MLRCGYVKVNGANLTEILFVFIKSSWFDEHN